MTWHEMTRPHDFRCLLTELCSLVVCVIAGVLLLAPAASAQELAMSQKEGDTLRGDLLANQKALSDLNVYADSLRSRYYSPSFLVDAGRTVPLSCT